MPIKWSALKVSEAMDMVEEFANQVLEPLESAKLIVEEAKKIPNLPQYMEQHISSVQMEIERVTGYTSPYSKDWYPGSIQRAIESVRHDLPKDAIEADKARAKAGSQQSLV